MDEAWSRVKRSIRLANAISDAENAHSLRTDLQRSAESVVERCRIERKRARASEVPADLGDEAVHAAAKWSERLPLQDYDGLLQHVPRLVNVVTCAEAVPVPGSGVKLPLDLHHIGARCSNAYFAPRRFSAVQLAFDWPRCRVLVFRTPNAYRNPHPNVHAFQTRTHLPTRAKPTTCLRRYRPSRRNWCASFHLVSARTPNVSALAARVAGCAGPMAARLSIMRAARQLAVEAGIHLHVRNFRVVNQV